MRHCLDVMHVKKNVCDSLIGTLLNILDTLLNIKGMTKEDLKCRQDLVDMRIREQFHPISALIMSHNVNNREEKFLSMSMESKSPTRILFKY